MMNQPEITIKANHLNENFIYEVNRNTFDQKSSKDVFDNHFNKKLFREETLYIFSGSDSGLLIDYLLEQTLPKGSKYFFVELDYIEVLIDKAGLLEHEQIFLSNQDSWEKELYEINISAYVHKISVVHIESLAALSLYDMNYHSLNLSLSKEVQTLLFSSYAHLSHSSIFIKQQLKTLPENIAPANCFIDKFKGLSCIVLAAGPSLSNHIKWIKKHRDKFIVLAVSRISARLIKENIVPDIIFTVDSYDISFTVSREMFLFKNPPILINSFHASSLITSQWHGQQFYLKDLLPWSSTLNETNIEALGPTVTNTALYTAIEMGFKHIYLLGVDLCFSQTGESHESSSIESKVKGTNLAKINEVVETYEGKYAETTIQYNLAAKAFEQLGDHATTKQTEVFNLSPSALFIKSIAFKSQKDVVIPPKLLPEQTSMFTQNIGTKERIQHLTELQKELTKIIKAINEIKLLSQSALVHNSKLFKNKNNEKANFSHKVKMDKIEKKLLNKYTVANDFLKKTGINFFTECITAQKKSEWTDELTKNTGQLYYQAYLKSYDSIMPELLAANKRILSRIDELSTSPNVSEIIQQWKGDKHFNRIKAIEHKNNTLFNLIRDSFPIEFNQLMELSEEQLTEVSSHEKSLVSSSRVKNIKKKIILRFKQKNKNNLTEMLNNLALLIKEENNTEKEEMLDAYNIIKAYLAVLDDDFTEALKAYSKVPEEKLEEDDYIIIAQCAVKTKNVELTESTFNTLSHLNYNYLPKLAQAQKINGKNQEAIESYSQYLTEKPHDIYQWLSLSKLLISLNQYDAALETIQCVLHQDPDNKTAKSYLEQLMPNQA